MEAPRLRSLIRCRTAGENGTFSSGQPIVADRTGKQDQLALAWDVHPEIDAKDKRSVPIRSSCAFRLWYIKQSSPSVASPVFPRKISNQFRPLPMSHPIHRGCVDVVCTVYGFVKKQMGTGRTLERGECSLPPLQYATRAFWLDVGVTARRRVQEEGRHFEVRVLCIADNFGVAAAAAATLLGVWLIGRYFCSTHNALSLSAPLSGQRELS